MWGQHDRPDVGITAKECRAEIEGVLGIGQLREPLIAKPELPLRVALWRTGVQDPGIRLAAAVAERAVALLG